MSAAAAPRAGDRCVHVADDVAEPVHDPALRPLDRGRHLVDAHGLPLPHQLGGVLAAAEARGAGALRVFRRALILDNRSSNPAAQPASLIRPAGMRSNRAALIGGGVDRRRAPQAADEDTGIGFLPAVLAGLIVMAWLGLPAWQSRRAPSSSQPARRAVFHRQLPAPQRSETAALRKAAGLPARRLCRARPTPAAVAALPHCCWDPYQGGRRLRIPRPSGMHSPRENG